MITGGKREQPRGVGESSPRFAYVAGVERLLANGPELGTGQMLDEPTSAAVVPL